MKPMKKETSCHVMFIDYDDEDASTYRGIYIFGLKDAGAKSYTGDPVRDYEAVAAWARENLSKPIVFSSSFEHFFMDSGRYTYKHGRRMLTDGDITYPEVIGIKKIPCRLNRKAKKPILVNASVMAEEHPDTFHRDDDAILEVGVGSVVKVSTGGERFWVMVTEEQRPYFTGTVNNHLLFTPLRFGEMIRFHADNIYDVEQSPKQQTKEA